MYPVPLQKLIDFFEHLSEQERRENLLLLAEQAKKQEPREGEKFELEDVRKDEECTDTVGIFLRVEDGGCAHFAITLGPKVQTLTRAMATILCRGLNGTMLQEVLNVPEDFVSRIIGADLVRQRSQTVYYVLNRMKAAVQETLKREGINGAI
ncbi:MAG: SufE family protein [Verrucomicrobia bacterium]|nr:SufE family protein [Verrucomicrobiota bacterium]